MINLRVTVLGLLLANVGYILWCQLKNIEINQQLSSSGPSPQLISFNRMIDVEMWSKAAIGQYVWENVLGGEITDHGLYIEGTKQIANITFRFRAGPSLKLQSFQQFPITNLVLILNWRNSEKINYSLPWLKMFDRKNELQNVGIIALGNENCDNRWVEPYLKRIRKIRFLFVTYDWNLVDEQKIFQWPLGLATYRHFPSSLPGQLDLTTERPYLCNFIGTVYPKSTREELQIFFENNLHYQCLVKTRSKWKSTESEESMNYYVEALQSSELTLSPIGRNHECYRILEAVEYGSIPVIEINLSQLSKGYCDRKHVLRVFQEFQAPFIYLRNWTEELPGILLKQKAKPKFEKIKERINLLKWYHRFKIQIRNKLINVIQNNFNTF